MDVLKVQTTQRREHMKKGLLDLYDGLYWLHCAIHRPCRY